MSRYLVRRLLIAIPSLLGISVVLFTVLALAPEMFPGIYPATKAFVLTLSQSLQGELADHDGHQVALTERVAVVA